MKCTVGRLAATAKEWLLYKKGERQRYYIHLGENSQFSQTRWTKNYL
jgi:hypothetical protein